MFNVGGGEILVILLLALLVLGPDKLPEYARKAGRYMNEFRRLTSGFQEEFRQAMDLSDSDSTTPAASGDALDRATEGPRLVAQPEPAAAVEPAGTAPAAEPPTPVVPSVPAAPAAPVSPPAPAYGGAFAADVIPAADPGPEVAGPAGSDHDGGTGSTSAA
jgi:sec-independent protein translocase protein TatB